MHSPWGVPETSPPLPPRPARLVRRRTRWRRAASCSVEVFFSPTQSGPLAGNLTIASSPPTPSFQVALSGNGLGFVLAAQGASSVTIASGQSASYMLQITAAPGSVGPITSFTCTAVPPNSICSVSPASFQQLSSGATASATVTIVTVADAGASPESRRTGSMLFAASLFPVGLVLLAFPRVRRRALPLAALVFVTFMPTSCGVTSTGGASSGSSPTSSPGSTPSATYSPVITATGPGIAQNVTLTLIVD